MMTQRQSAIVLTLLAAVYGGALVLFAPELDSYYDRTDFLFAGVVVGFVVAAPAFLALWAAHGRQRATVRLPLTAWFCSLYFLAAVYGVVRCFGAGRSDIVLPMLVACVIAYLADLFLLRVLRAVRGWRLERIEDETASAAANPKRQFTIRTLLVWTSAAAALFAGLSWLTPYGVFGEDGIPAGSLGALLSQGVVPGLVYALAGLPVVSVALIVLTDGRRTVWRCGLALVTAVCIAGGAAAMRGIGAEPQSPRHSPW